MVLLVRGFGARNGWSRHPFPEAQHRGRAVQLRAGQGFDQGWWFMFLRDEPSIEQLARGVIDRTLPKRDWTHAGHFAAAVWLCRYRPDLATPDGIRMVISRYNDATGTPNTDTGGYHHTITLASMRAAAAALASATPDTPIEVVLSALLASRFGNPDWLLAHWSRDRLFSVAARQAWVRPDLAPLPF